MSRADKPTAHDLGLDVDRLSWQGSGVGAGRLEVAFAGGWVLMRVRGDADGRVLVFDHNEWDCFVRGVKDHEFDREAPPRTG